jgi:F-type H+-transporting ATPase subunit b
MFYEPEFWVLVAFVITVALLWKPARVQLTSALDARALRIKEQIEEAQRLRKEADETLILYRQKQRDALKEADEIVARAKAEAERIGAEAARDLEASLERRRHQALEKIAQAEAKALAEVRNVAVDVAIGATRTLIQQHLTEARGAALIDNAIADLPKHLH